MLSKMRTRVKIIVFDTFGKLASPKLQLAFFVIERFVTFVKNLSV